MVSQVGDGIFQIAAANLLLFKEPGNNPALRLLVLTAITLIPFSVISPFVGVFIDRWDRRKILTWVPIARAVAAVLTPIAAGFGTTSWAFLTAVLFVLSANRFFLATMSALLPQMVLADDLLVANSVSSTGGSIANVVGLTMGAALTGIFDGTQATVFAAIAFGAGALAAHRVPVHRGYQVHRDRLVKQMKIVAGEMVEGIRAVASDERVRFGLATISVVQVLVGLMSGVLIHAFIIDLKIPLNGALGLLTLLAAGIGVGVVLVPLAGRRVRHDVLIPASFVIAAIGVAIGGGPPRLSRLSVGTLFLGLAYAFAKIPVDTIVQEEMPDELRGRAFAAYDMLFNIARVGGVGMAAAFFASGMSASTASAWGAGSYLVAAVAAAGWERSMFKRRKGRPVAELLVAGEMVTVKGQPDQRAEEAPAAIVIAGQTIPIDHIEHGSIFEEEDGRRGRAFTVAIEGRTVRLLRYEDEIGWLIDTVDVANEPEEQG